VTLRDDPLDPKVACSLQRLDKSFGQFARDGTEDVWGVGPSFAFGLRSPLGPAHAALLIFLAAAAGTRIIATYLLLRLEEGCNL